MRSTAKARARAPSLLSRIEHGLSSRRLDVSPHEARAKSARAAEL
jgi:hypothetical protein